MRGALWLVCFAAGCQQQINVTQTGMCDGVLEKGEGTVDAPFDKDGDGYFDANNPNCAETYAAAKLDCNDGDATIHPGAAEVKCNGVDDDCDASTTDGAGVDNDNDKVDECTDCDDSDGSVYPGNSETTCNGKDDDCDVSTPDAPDKDADGVGSCDGDCNDGNPDISPNLDEACDDGLDNDCDSLVDEDCGHTDWSGDYTLDTNPTYKCASGSVKINFTTMTVVDIDPSITFKSDGSSQPGTMTGTVSDATGKFTADRTISGSCDETYTITGQFTDPNNFTAQFSAEFSGGACFDCKNQYWTVNGTK